MKNSEKPSEDKLPDRCELYGSLKDGCISEKDGHICEENYLLLLPMFGMTLK